MPEVTVIIPTKDRGPLLQRCIESVLIQSEKPRILVFDDGSTEPFTWKGDGVEIRRVDESIGQCGARNSWVEDVETPFVKWIDSDDFLPDRNVLLHQIEFLNAHPELDFCWDGFNTINYRTGRLAAGRPRQDTRLEGLVLPEWFIYGHTTYVPTQAIQIGTAMFRTKVAQRVEWDENFRAGGADLKFFSDVVNADFTGAGTDYVGLNHTLNSPGPLNGGRYA